MHINRSTSRAALLAAAVLGMGLSVAQAQTRTYSFDFTVGTLATDVASWNYTAGSSYSSGSVGAASPTLLVRGMSGSSDHAIVTSGGVTGYNVRTVQLGQADFGFYVMNLDFRDVVAGENVLVSYSFKIQANDTNASINPADWAVKHTTGATTAGAASFGGTAQSFSFVDDNVTWTTVSGSFVVNTGVGSAGGGLLINAGSSGSGYTSGGGVTIGDLQVTVSSISAVPEPSSFAMLGGLAALGGALIRRRRRG